MKKFIKLLAFIAMFQNICSVCYSAEALVDYVSADSIFESASEYYSSSVYPSDLYVESVGQIPLFINNKQVTLKTPIIIRENKILVSLKDIASALNYSFLDMKEGKARLISPKGLTQNIEAYLIEEALMLDQEQIGEYFSVESRYAAEESRLFVFTEEAPKFKTYLIESEETQPQELKKSPVLMEPEDSMPDYIPEAARPYIDLNGSVAYTHRDYNLHSPYRSQIYSLWGRFYDYEIRFESSWKDDMQEEFDHDYTYLNMDKENLWIGLFDQSMYLGLLRNQSQSFSGVKIIKGWDDSLNKTTFFGGKVENHVSGTGGTVKYTGQMLGIEEDYNPLDWLGLKGRLIYMKNDDIEPHYLSGTTSFPRRNLIYSLGSSLKLYDDISLFMDMAQCYYEPDNQQDESVVDIDWRVGTEWDFQKGSARFAYEFVGDEYVSLGNPASYQDYKGGDLGVNYKVTDSWWLYSSMRKYRDNVDDDSSRITTDNQTFSLSSSHRFLKDQSITLRFDQFNSDPSGPDAGSTTKTNIQRIDYFLPFLFDSRLLLSYQYSTLDSDGTSDYNSHSPGMSLFGSFGRGSSWYLRQDFTDTNYKDGSDTSNYSLSFNINHMVNPRLKIDFDSSYSHDREDGEETSETLSSSVNLGYRLTPKTNVNLEYAINSYDLRVENGWPEDWSVMVYLKQDFNIKSEPNFGIIKGRVILDADADGRIDWEEAGIEGAGIKLGDGRRTITGAEGYFSFPYVCPGDEKVYLDLADVPLEWTTAELQKTVEIEPAERVFVDFLLVKSASIKGKVFIDINNDMVFQEDEEPLEGAVVLLLTEDLEEKFRRTTEDGDFRFDHLLPGKYKISIYPEDLPKGLKIVSSQERELEVFSGENIEDLSFALQWEYPAKKF